MAYSAGLGVRFGKRRGHDVKRVTRTLATGERRTYFYYRPTMRRLKSEPGTDAFEAELADARAGRTRPAAGVDYIYFVHAPLSRRIKIGRAADPYRRLQILQVGSPEELVMLGWLRTTPGSKLERNIHGLFKRHRTRGEWFEACDLILDFAKSKCRL